MQYVELKTKMALISLKDKIDNYQLKAEDPNKLSVKITETKNEIRDIENRLIMD